MIQICIVGNAVLGVPSNKFDLDGQIYSQALKRLACASRNAGDGVPYGDYEK